MYDAIKFETFFEFNSWNETGKKENPYMSMCLCACAHIYIYKSRNKMPRDMSVN